ncbi:uncharacterized protein METZ01_LOCUS62901 [marine metagenome]|uniref:Uncharacterized protein n=1 Tax=marine metagenome TaxID=408172 RepID=A0A381T5U2_9ZZZZ
MRTTVYRLNRKYNQRDRCKKEITVLRQRDVT